MAKPDPTSPATKADIKLLMDSIGKLYDANKRWKDEIVGSMDQWKDDIRGHFDVAVEQIRDDLKGANKDRIENHEHRLRALEMHKGLAAA